MGTLTLPRLGETMEEARVTEWLVAPGMAFARGDVLLEVETDKTVVEVPALKAGVMVAHLVAVGDTVALDQPIAEVQVPGEAPTGIFADDRVSAGAAVPDAEGARVAPAGGDGADAAHVADAGQAANSPEAPGAVITSDPASTSPDARPTASPRARAEARRAGIALEGIRGTGRHGRITGPDVARHLAADQRIGQSGARPAIVLLHGLFDDTRGWRDLPDRLRAVGLTVIAPDLPGHGSHAGTAPSIGAMVDLLVPLLPDGPVHLVGHSLGAVVAVHIARRIGRRAVHLTLISAAGLGPRLNADFFDGMAQADTPAALARALALLGTGAVSDRALDGMLAQVRKRRVDVTPFARALVLGGIQQTDIASDLAALAVPVTAVFGLEDQVLDWRDCAALPARAAIHLVPGAGHLPHAHDPGLVAGLILRACGLGVKDS